LAEDLQALQKDAEAAFDTREWDRALEKYEKILEVDPQNEGACYKLAEIYALRGLITKVIEQYFQLMNILEAKGDLQLAADVATWIMKLDPLSHDARMKLVLIHRKRGQDQEAVALSLQLARLLITMGEGDQAIMLLQTALEQDSGNLEIGLELAEVYIQHGHIEEGSAQYRRIANAYLEKKQYERAADAFKRMKVVHMDDQEILFALGNIYAALGRLDEAEAEFRSILRHNLNHVEALTALGNVCQQKRQYHDAILAFKKILTIRPADILAKERLGELHQASGAIAESVKNYLTAAQAYQAGGEMDKAIRIYQRVLTLDPTNPTSCRELTNLGAPLESEEKEEEIPAFKPEPIRPLEIKEPTAQPMASPAIPSLEELGLEGPAAPPVGEEAEFAGLAAAAPEAEVVGAATMITEAMEVAAPGGEITPAGAAPAPPKGRSGLMSVRSGKKPRKKAEKQEVAAAPVEAALPSQPVEHKPVFTVPEPGAKLFPQKEETPVFTAEAPAGSTRPEVVISGAPEEEGPPRKTIVEVRVVGIEGTVPAGAGEPADISIPVAGAPTVVIPGLIRPERVQFEKPILGTAAEGPSAADAARPVPKETLLHKPQLVRRKKDTPRLLERTLSDKPVLGRRPSSGDEAEIPEAEAGAPAPWMEIPEHLAAELYPEEEAAAVAGPPVIAPPVIQPPVALPTVPVAAEPAVIAPPTIQPPSAPPAIPVAAEPAVIAPPTIQPPPVLAAAPPATLPVALPVAPPVAPPAAELPPAPVAAAEPMVIAPPVIQPPVAPAAALPAIDLTTTIEVAPIAPPPSPEPVLELQPAMMAELPVEEIYLPQPPQADTTLIIEEFPVMEPPAVIAFPVAMTEQAPLLVSVEASPGPPPAISIGEEMPGLFFPPPFPGVEELKLAEAPALAAEPEIAPLAATPPAEPAPLPSVSTEGPAPLPVVSVEEPAPLPSVSTEGPALLPSVSTEGPALLPSVSAEETAPMPVVPVKATGPVREQPPAPEPQIPEFIRAAITPAAPLPGPAPAEIDRLEEYLARGDISRAIEAHRLRLRISPDEVELRQQLAELYLKYHFQAEAAAEYRLLLRRSPENTHYHARLERTYSWGDDFESLVECRIELGRLYRQRGERPQALETLLKIVALEPTNTRARESLAELFMELNDLPMARHHYEAVGNYYLEESQHEKAIEIYRKIYSIGRDVASQEKLAGIYARCGRNDDAIREYQFLADRALDEQETRRAISAIEHIIELDPNRLQTHQRLMELYGQVNDKRRYLLSKYRIGQLLWHDKQVDRAQDLFEEVLRADPGHHESRRILVEVYLKKGLMDRAMSSANILIEFYAQERQYERAIELVRILVSADPANCDLRERLIEFHQKTGNRQESLVELMALAEVQGERNEWDRAAATLGRALELEPENIPVHFRLGEIYADRKNQLKEALAEFARVHALDPTHKDAVRRLISGYLKDNRPQEAVRFIQLDEENKALVEEILGDYRRRIEERPEDLATRYNLGVIFKELGRLDEAIEQFQKTKGQVDLELKSLNMLGLCFAQKPGMGMKNLAVKQFMKGLQRKDGPQEDLLELNYNLARHYENNGMLHEALKYYQECYIIDITYRDVDERIKTVEKELTPSAETSSKIAPFPTPQEREKRLKDEGEKGGADSLR